MLNWVAVQVFTLDVIIIIIIENISDPIPGCIIK